MTGFQIRTYRPADLPRIKELTAEGFENVSIDGNIERRFGTINKHDWRWRKSRQIDDDVARRGAALFVAQSGDQVVGYITTWIDEEAGIGHIPNLAVDARYRGQAIGRGLIEHALAHFRASGASHARIETLDQNAIGQKLYPSLGFEEVARQIHYAMALKP